LDSTLRLKSKIECVRLIKFCVVGLANTAVDFGVFLSLVHLGGISPLLANVISYCLAVLNSYAMNMTWTFRELVDEDATSRTFMRFASVNTLGLAISSLVILIARPFFAIEVAKILSVLCTLAWNFLGTRILVFRKQ